MHLNVARGCSKSSNELPGLERGLPPGAWDFAADSEHYSFHGRRCVKDLELVDIVGPARKEGKLNILFSRTTGSTTVVYVFSTRA
jgi:hypothetical protein